MTGELISSCKLIDAVLAVDINLVCNEVCVCCADAVRFFHMNSNQLSQIAQVSVKAAQVVQYMPCGVVVGSNNQIGEICSKTHRLNKISDAHSTTVTDIVEVDHQTYLSVDMKGLIQVFKFGNDKSVCQFNVRQQLSGIKLY